MSATKTPVRPGGMTASGTRGGTKARAGAKAAVRTGTKAPARRPGRRRRRRPSLLSQLLGLVVAVAAVTGVLYVLMRIVGGGHTDQAQATPRPSVQATAVPTATPEPTPGLPSADLDSWMLRLIDYDHPLGEDFAPEELADVGDGQQMDARVAPMLLKLIEDAHAAGFTTYVCSGYRDYDTQDSIYQRHIDQYTAEGMTEAEAHAKTRLAVNYPGSSEHQSGLCVDLLEYNGQDMEPYIGGSGLMLWLEQHCAEYGFVVRYPDGKTGITGVEYEPWHLRYVGGQVSGYIMEHGLCLEEFLDLYKEG